MINKIIGYRRVRAGQLTVAQELPLTARNIFSGHRYRAQGLAKWPPEIIQNFIILHPPVVIKRPDGIHAIGNFRSVELAGLLHPHTRVPVLEHTPVPQHRLSSESAGLEFSTLTVGALSPAGYEQSVMTLWELYRDHDGFPDDIRTKRALAEFLSINRRRLSQPMPDAVQPTFRVVE